jgi:DNA-binding transcriptional regulator GbsR (MarR family)
MDACTITAKEIAEITGVVKSTILRRVKRGNWLYHEGRNRTKIFMIAGLPEDIKKTIVAYERKQQEINALWALIEAVRAEVAKPLRAKMSENIRDSIRRVEKLLAE